MAEGAISMDPEIAAVTSEPWRWWRCEGGSRPRASFTTQIPRDSVYGALLGQAARRGGHVVPSARRTGSSALAGQRYLLGGFLVYAQMRAPRPSPALITREAARSAVCFECLWRRLQPKEATLLARLREPGELRGSHDEGGGCCGVAKKRPPNCCSSNYPADLLIHRSRAGIPVLLG